MKGKLTWLGFCTICITIELMVGSGCGKSVEAAQADAASLLQASSNTSTLGTPEVIFTGKAIGCRATQMAHVYYCAWQMDFANGKSQATATLSLEDIPPGTAVVEERLFYRYGDGSDDWAYGFFLRPALRHVQ